jgi:hypothetical protein
MTTKATINRVPRSATQKIEIWTVENPAEINTENFVFEAVKDFKGSKPPRMNYGDMFYKKDGKKVRLQTIITGPLKYDVKLQTYSDDKNGDSGDHKNSTQYYKIAIDVNSDLVSKEEKDILYEWADLLAAFEQQFYRHILFNCEEQELARFNSNLQDVNAENVKDADFVKSKLKNFSNINSFIHPVKYPMTKTKRNGEWVSTGKRDESQPTIFSKLDYAWLKQGDKSIRDLNKFDLSVYSCVEGANVKRDVNPSNVSDILRKGTIVTISVNLFKYCIGNSSMGPLLSVDNILILKESEGYNSGRGVPAFVTRAFEKNKKENGKEKEEALLDWGAEVNENENGNE